MNDGHVICAIIHFEASLRAKNLEMELAVLRQEVERLKQEAEKKDGLPADRPDTV